MVEVRGICRAIYAIYVLSAYEQITEKKIMQYGEYPISVKRSRGDFRAKCRFDNPHSN